MGGKRYARLGMAAVAMVAASVIPWVSPAAVVATGARTIPPAGRCTNPAHHGATPPPHGLDPAQLAAAYGVSGLWQAGFRGQGRHVALLEVGQSLEKTSFATFSDCYGPFPTPVEHLVVGTNPTPGGEGIFDPHVVASIAPQATIDMFESGSGENQTSLPRLIDAALDPANTGGTLVDTISTSFGRCEAALAPADVAAVQAALRRAADLGVAVFAAAGDSGSAAGYRAGGETTCIGHPVDTHADKGLGVDLGVGFPASSPLVTSVGGTELAIDGAVPRDGSPQGGTITDEPVWMEAQPKHPELVYGGGGGHSRLFTVADAPWQAAIGLSGPESKPDIAALAGSPDFLNGGIGTSGASPLMAGAIAVLDGFLAGHGGHGTGPLNPVLYQLAANPTTRAEVFHDVVHGTNDVLGLGCCTAGPGYDTASGLGSLDVQALGQALVADPSVLAATTSTTIPTVATSPAGPPGGASGAVPPAGGKHRPSVSLGSATPASATGIGHRGGRSALVIVLVVLGVAVAGAAGAAGLRRRRPPTRSP